MNSTVSNTVKIVVSMVVVAALVATTFNSKVSSFEELLCPVALMVGLNTSLTEPMNVVGESLWNLLIHVYDFVDSPIMLI